MKRLVLSLGLLAVIWFQVWTISTSCFPVYKLSRHESDYYNLLAEGFLQGHLYLNREVPAALINAEDPYDPAKRPASAAMHDVSYYRGHFYLYFGAAPVLVLFVPFKLLTGYELPQAYGNLIFVILGFILAASLFLKIRRKYFSSSGTLAGLGGVLVLGFCAMTAAVLRRPSIWELPIAAGYTFAMACLACCYAGFHAKKHRAAWWLATGLCLGFAIGSRPVYIAGVGLLAVALLWCIRAEGTSFRAALRERRWWKDAIALALGFGLPLFGIFLYNFLRFGNPLEFGLKYQLTALYEAHVQHFSLRFIPYNFYIYYLAPAHLGRYFPFFQLITPPAKAPEGYYGFEFPYGVWVNMPCLCLGFASAGVATFGRNLGAGLRGFLLSNSIFYVGLAVFLLGFVTGAQRYMADFTPSLALLAAVGLLVVEEVIRQHLGRWRNLAFAVLGGAVVWSVFFGAMISFQLHGIYRFVAPDSYDRIARRFNYPAHYLEKAFHDKPGPVNLRLRFPTNRAGTVEPILATGWEFYSDHVFVHYLDDRHLRIGFEHVSHDAVYSEPLEIDYAKEHTLTIEMGSLYPPRSHPFFDRLSAMAAASLTNWLCIKFDDTTVLQRAQAFYDSAPESVLIGGGHPIEIFGKTFSGRILQISRSAAAKWKLPPTFDGPASLQIYFPDNASGRVQPLIVCGKTGRANALYARFVAPGKIKFGIDCWGIGSIESEVVSFDTKQVHEIKIAAPGLLNVELPTNDARGDAVLLEMDGQPVWHARIPQRLSPGQPLEFGRNLIGLSTCEAEFQGTILGIQNAGTEKPLPKVSGAARFAMEFFPARNRAGQTDPLLILGRAPKADVISMKYETNDIVRFNFDHWAAPTKSSPAIQLTPEQPHQLSLTLTPRNDGSVEMLVELDGRLAWRTSETFYELVDQAVSLGVNDVGATTCNPQNGGQIFSARYEPLVEK